MNQQHTSEAEAGDLSRAHIAASAKKYLAEQAIPLVFHPGYDIALPKLYERQPFDFEKRGKVYQKLAGNFALRLDDIAQPEEVSRELLETVHDKDYLKSLEDVEQLVRIMGLPQLSQFSAEQLDRHLLSPIRRAAGGSLLATEIAKERGWAVNLSGGFHHAKPDKGGGFCFYNDIALMVQMLRREEPDMRILIIDLDAHLGDGTIRALYKDNDSILFDVFNQDIFPRDMTAAALAEFAYPVRSGLSGHEYLGIVRANIPYAFHMAKPDFVIFNAGADVHQGDKLGRLALTKADVAERDRIVIDAARELGLPIVTLLAGAYSETAWEVIADSLSRNFGGDIRKAQQELYLLRGNSSEPRGQAV